MIHIALPVHGRAALTRCAVTALDRTVRQPFKVWVLTNESPILGHRRFTSRDGSRLNAWKLDAILQALPDADGWFFTMHSDSAPLAPGWLDWLIDRMGDAECAGFQAVRGKPLPHPWGALYRVAWLRATKASFQYGPHSDVGADLPRPAHVYFAPQPPTRPWWLAHAGVGADETGRLLFAHLGGGTIGPTKYRLRRTLLRLLWPRLVRRHLDLAGAPAR